MPIPKLIASKTPRETSFGKRLKQFRKSRKLRQKEVPLNCSAQTISNWESGLFLPSEKRFDDLCKALRLTVEEQAELLTRYLEDTRHRRVARLGIDRALRGAYEHRLFFAEQLKVPLYTSTDTADPWPLLVTGEPTDWRGKYAYPPLDDRLYKMLAGRPYTSARGNKEPPYQSAGISRKWHCFGYEIDDDTMAPRFHTGDILYCWITQMEVRTGQPVIACLGDRVVCRIVEKRGRGFRFRTVKGRHAGKAQQARWFYPVIKGLVNVTPIMG